MLEILVLMALMMAGHRKGGYPSKGRYALRGVRYSISNPLGTLGNITVISVGITGSADGAYRMISVQGVWSLKNLTSGEGPIVVGFAHSDYTVVEVKEAIEANASISVGDKVTNEKANRLVRIVGVFEGDGDDLDTTLNDGRPIKTRLNWFIPIGKAVNLFAYNDSGATLTTGAIVDLSGKCWVKDSQ